MQKAARNFLLFLFVCPALLPLGCTPFPNPCGSRGPPTNGTAWFTDLLMTQMGPIKSCSLSQGFIMNPLGSQKDACARVT